MTEHSLGRDHTRPSHDSLSPAHPVAAPEIFAALSSALVVVAGCNADGAFDQEVQAIRGALRVAQEGAAMSTKASPDKIRPLCVLDFPSKVSRVYAIAPEADAMDVQMLLEARIAQLDAMLLSAYGQGGESFRAMADDAQDEFMWACAYMATEIRSLFSALGTMRAAGGAK